MPGDQTPPVEPDLVGVLELDGVFRMGVARGWRITGIPGSRYKVTDDEHEVDVSVRVRRDGPPDDARATVLAFARLTGATGAVHLTVPGHDAGGRALVRFESGADEWIAVVLCHDRWTVLGSARAARGDAALATCERMLSTMNLSAGRRRRRPRR